MRWIGAILLCVSFGTTTVGETPPVPFRDICNFTFCLSRDSKKVATNCWAVWDIATRKRILSGEQHANRWMNFSPDGKLLAVVGNLAEFFVYNTSDGSRYWNLTLWGHGDAVNRCVDFTSDSKHMISLASNGTLKIWDVEKKQAVALFYFQPKNEFDIGCYQEYLRAWRALAGNVPPDHVKTHVEFEGKYLIGHFSLHPDDTTIALQTGTPEVELLNWKTGKLLPALKTNLRWVYSVRFSRDGKFLAVGGGDITSLPDRGNCTVEWWDTTTWKRIRTFKGHAKTVLRLAVSPDNKYVASGSVEDGVKVWEAETGKELYVFDRNPNADTVGLEFLDENTLLTYSSSHGDPIRFWDLRTGKRIPMDALKP